MHNFIKVKTKTSLRGLKQARNKLIISTKQQKMAIHTEQQKLPILQSIKKSI